MYEKEKLITCDTRSKKRDLLCFRLV